MKSFWGALTVALVTTTRIAGADPAAEKLFRDGKALMKAGKVAEACDAFERSDSIEPKIGTMLNLADCRERQGRSATAWALFLEAKARAAPTSDPRGDTAKERAARLEPELAYLTIKVAPDRNVDGLVIMRGETVVPPMAWNTALPLDPTDYKIEARAPNHNPWSVRQLVKPGDRVVVTVGPLIAETAAAPEAKTPPPVDVATAEPAQPASDADVVVTEPATARDPIATRRHLAVGVALGVAAGTTSSSPPQNAAALEDDHMPVGLRLLGSLPVPRGAVRGIGSVLYTKGLNDRSDPTNTKKLFVIGLAADYVYMPSPKFGFAVGLGIGWDHERRAGDGGTDTSRWESLRASPFIFRAMDGRLELGLHAQLIRRGDEAGFIGLAAVDVFLL